MEYLLESDIKKQCTAEDLDVLSQSDESTKTSAEGAAIAFFRGYLRRYDVDEIFNDINQEDRDPALVMFLVDYFLYILYSAQPDRLIPDMRVRRRDEVVEWLKGVQRGDISPDLLTLNSDDETDINGPIRYGSGTRVSSNW